MNKTSAIVENRAAAIKRAVMEELKRHRFVPARWLPGRHAQSIWPSLFRKRPPLPNVGHVRLETPDGDFLDTYVQPGKPGAPTVILLHGLEGSFRSRYIAGMHHALEQVGWGAVTIAHRSCGGEMNRAKRLYHMGETSDLAFIVDYLAQRPETTRLYLIGYSLGANVLAKWLGESGDNIPAAVAGGAAVSAPYDSRIGGPFLDRPSMRIYREKFLRTLRKKAVEKDRQYPGVINLQGVLTATTFEQFDDCATAPLHGFKHARDYWRRVSCGQFLGGVRRPLLLLSAEDDPFVPPAAFPAQIAEESDYLYPLSTAKGGHVGFVSGPFLRPRFWHEEQIVRFFRLLERHHD